MDIKLTLNSEQAKRIGVLVEKALTTAQIKLDDVHLYGEHDAIAARHYIRTLAALTRINEDIRNAIERADIAA